MNINSQELWERFKKSFIKNIKGPVRDKTYLPDKSKTGTVAERKNFFKKHLFPAMSKDLDLKFEIKEEFLRVDYTFFKKGTENKFLVPMICIESENSWNPGSYEKEVRKLCSLTVPLKILIMYGLNEENSKAFDIHKDQGGNEHYWDYILPGFKNENMLAGLFVVMVYDKHDEERIVFRTKVYDENGKIVNKEKGETLIVID